MSQLVQSGGTFSHACTHCALLKACTEWTVQTLVLKSSNSCFSLIQLARISAKGHIGELVFFREKLYEDAFPKPEIENVKALWEISEELTVVKEEEGWGNKVRCVGGRGEGPKMTWEEVYESFLKDICC